MGKAEKMGSSGENETKYFSLEEVSNHNKSRGEDRSIWMVIHDKVYDVTRFLDEHPGGEGILTWRTARVGQKRNCGHWTQVLGNKCSCRRRWLEILDRTHCLSVGIFSSLQTVF